MSLSIINDCLSIITSIVAIISLIISVKTFRRIRDMSILHTMIFEALQNIKSMNRSLDEIKRGMLTLNENIGSLSSSIDPFLKEIMEKKRVGNRFPKPEESKMIRDTILELINTELLLNKNMRIPNRQATENIIYSTIETYQEINTEYLIKTCLAVIENFILNVSGQ